MARTGRPETPITERIEAGHIKVSCGCWIWIRDLRGSNSYGSVWYKKRNQPAHRISYTLNIGPIPDGMLVLHRCDNPACINPDHLFLGTHQDNMTDRNNKKRQAYGERNAAAKLTEKQVLEIRELPLKEAMLKFSISETNYRQIKRREIWKYL